MTHSHMAPIASDCIARHCRWSTSSQLDCACSLAVRLASSRISRLITWLGLGLGLGLGLELGLGAAVSAPRDHLLDPFRDEQRPDRVLECLERGHPELRAEERLPVQHRQRRGRHRQEVLLP